MKRLARSDGKKNHPDELWEQEKNSGRAVRPVLADVGETAQFLATKTLVLDYRRRDQFLDHLYKDLAEALRRLIRISKGDYSPTRTASGFRNLKAEIRGETPTQVFERWVAEREPAAGTVEGWQYVFREMDNHFKGRVPRPLLPTRRNVDHGV